VLAALAGYDPVNPNGLAGDTPFIAARRPGLRDLNTQLQRLATRITNNRVVAGVHFPIDGTAGRMVGESVAEYLLYRCGHGAQSTGWVPRQFLGGALVGQDPLLKLGFNRGERLDNHTGASVPTALPPHFAANTAGPTAVAGLVPGGLVARLYQQALREWQ
jgi:hypothetical protein